MFSFLLNVARGTVPMVPIKKCRHRGKLSATLTTLVPVATFPFNSYNILCFICSQIKIYDIL